MNKRLFSCPTSGLEIFTPDCNLDTVLDGRGVVLTYFPDSGVKEFNIVRINAGKYRGEHFHPHFVEHSLVVAGSGLFVYLLDSNDLESKQSFPIGVGTCVKIPTGVAHTIHAIDDLTIVALLSKEWDECDPPIVSVK